MMTEWHPVDYFNLNPLRIQLKIHSVTQNSSYLMFGKSSMVASQIQGKQLQFKCIINFKGIYTRLQRTLTVHLHMTLMSRHCRSPTPIYKTPDR